MAAYFGLRLDTTPPRLHTTNPVFAGRASFRLPFTLSEPELLSVVAEEAGGRSIAGSIAASEASFDLGGEKWQGGTVFFHVRDDVWNETTYSLDLPAQTTVVWQEVDYKLTTQVPKRPRGPFTEATRGPDPADLASMYRQRFF